MKFSRKDNQTQKILHLLVAVLGICIIYLGYAKLYWTWNVLTFPLGLIIAVSGYKNFKKSDHVIKEINFGDDIICIEYLNGLETEVKTEKLSYSLLVKKFYKPIRSLEIFEKRKVGLFRGKSLGIIHINKWDNIEDIAKHLIRNKYERKKWKFGWSTTDFLMLFAILIGLTEGVAGGYVKSMQDVASQSLGEIGEAMSDAKSKEMEDSIRAEEKYFKK